MKTYQELTTFDTYEERFQYLSLDGSVGEDLFGYLRILNQQFYQTREWLNIRDRIIVRDNGCEMGLKGYEIPGIIIVHHIEPLRVEDYINKSSKLLDPNNLVCVSDMLHRSIHYGIEQLSDPLDFNRKPYDTCPWRQD